MAVIGRLISWVLPYAWPLACAAFLALAAGASVQTLRLAHAQREGAEVLAAWASDRAQAAERARSAEAEYRTKEAADAARVRTAEGNYDALQNRHTSTLAAHRASDSQLRNQLAAYAAGSREPTDHSCAAERGRAETLGLLLANGVRLQEELARDAEAASDAVRALRQSWPVNAKP